MAFVITAPCVADYSCVEVCPVQHCIAPHPSEQAFLTTAQLYINPALCINCEACVEACPVDAIYKDNELPAEWEHYRDLNRDYFHRELDR